MRALATRSGRWRQTVRVLTQFGSPEPIETDGVPSLSRGYAGAAMSDLFVADAARVGD
ncbi:MAG: hypothetical protein ACK5Q5_24340 [Planctomycetaceae bacterium]